MIPTTFEYVRAASLDEAVAKLKAANGGGKFIAGGHSLVPLMKLRLSEPQLLIDISRIPDLAGISDLSSLVDLAPPPDLAAPIDLALPEPKPSRRLLATIAGVALGTHDRECGRFS